jgi:alcohol dehydrogenase (NADP+)
MCYDFFSALSIADHNAA